MSTSDVVKSVPMPSVELRKQAIQDLMDRGLEASAENLLRESMRKGAVLYDYFASIPRVKWAQIGQYQAARHIIDKTKVDMVIGGKTFNVRMVEFVRDDQGEGSYHSTRDIVMDAELQQRYMAEISGLMRQAQEKVDTLRAMMRASRDEQAEAAEEDPDPTPSPRRASKALASEARASA